MAPPTTLGFVLLELLAVAATCFAVLLSGNALAPSLAMRLSLVRRELSADGARGLATGMVQGLGDRLKPLVWRVYDLWVGTKLAQAPQLKGWRSEDLFALQLVGLVGGALVVALAPRLPLWSLLLTAPGAAALPLLWLDDQVRRRTEEISRALPFSLDLLTLAVEAGLDVASALAKVVEKGKPGALREELAVALHQLKLGRTRAAALKEMAVRVDVPALSRFVAALVQADKMGSNLGKVLRIQARQLRVERSHRAEKLANQAPVKMLFPLVVCIFPTVFLVLFGPLFYAYVSGRVVP